MEQWIEDQFSEDLLKQASRQFQADAADAKKLGDFENYVFEVYRNDQPYILRLTHSSHRSKSEVEAELEWINYLHKQGLNASSVHPSTTGDLVAEIPIAKGTFYVCLFDQAPGQPVKASDEAFGPELFEKWGSVIGKMHRWTKEFKPGISRRERWDQDDLLDFRSYLNSKQDSAIISSGEKLIRDIQALPENKDSFGLIHNDLHSGNFFIDQGELHIFDFDDSTYGYYVSDIAIPMYYAVLVKCGGEELAARSHFAKEFLTHFLKGYQKENSVDPVWISRLPLFLRLRDYTLYTVFHKKFDVKKLADGEKQLVAQIRTQLLNEEPMVELDYQDILEKVKLP
ncbi:phosphotransferase enzyme family protein [Halobacillus naozhouensis]|uniref:Phosphotransferase n=1 Tax=Halobacillus naozhouensis TaxID=554880 RepID=A0ABY8IY90_9BACI|nr:phosphotransferase [Halobacillus naozhouensis]WFT74322.1 phosphotransferase [Halobacillus naozhouensis]